MMAQTPASALNGVAQPLVCRPEAPLRVRPPIAADLADARRRLKAWLGARPWQAVSLGQNCNVAWYLSQVGAKAFSGPFDWIFSAALLIVGIWYLIELGFLRGTVGSNEYGPDPLEGR